MNTWILFVYTLHNRLMHVFGIFYKYICTSYVNIFRSYTFFQKYFLLLNYAESYAIGCSDLEEADCSFFKCIRKINIIVMEMIHTSHITSDFLYTLFKG